MTRRQERSQQPAGITGASRLPPGSPASPAPASVFQGRSSLPAAGRRNRKVTLDSALSGRPELHGEAHVSSPPLAAFGRTGHRGQLVTYPPAPRSRRPAVRMAAAHPPPRVQAALAIRARNLAETIQSTAADAIAAEHAEAPRD
jgi:hypothetical protein